MHVAIEFDTPVILVTDPTRAYTELHCWYTFPILNVTGPIHVPT